MALSARAAAVLNGMEPHINYGLKELRAFAPDLTLEALQDVMRELWVQRQVERVGYSGWRRQSSSSPAEQHTRPAANARRASDAPARSSAVKPEDMFDHSEFEDMFK